MWVIFEGLDKTGKTTLEWALHKATNYKHVVIDRGPAGYKAFDEIFNRLTEKGNNEYNKQIKQVNDLDNFIVVYCTTHDLIAKKRLEQHNESCHYDYVSAQTIYRNKVYQSYKYDKIVELDTTYLTIDECIGFIIKKIEEIAYEKNN